MDVGTGVPTPPAKEKPPLTVVGDVGGRIAIMVVCFCFYIFAGICLIPHTVLNKLEYRAK